MAASNTQSVNEEQAGNELPAEKPVLRYEDEHFIDTTKSVWNYSFFTDEDITNYKQGTLYNGYLKFGSHHREVLTKDGFYFAVWAPNASFVSVIGDFNGWKSLCRKVKEDYINGLSMKNGMT